MQEEVYRFFASETFMLASHRLPLIINFSVSRQLGSKNYGALPLVRELVADLLLLRPKFSPRRVQMGFVAHKVALGQAVLYYSFPLSLFFYRYSILTSIHLPTTVHNLGR